MPRMLLTMIKIMMILIILSDDDDDTDYDLIGCPCNRLKNSWKGSETQSRRLTCFCCNDVENYNKGALVTALKTRNQYIDDHDLIWCPR